jgi:hypothetical protein
MTSPPFAARIPIANIELLRTSLSLCSSSLFIVGYRCCTKADEAGPIASRHSAIVPMEKDCSDMWRVGF